MKNLKEIIIDLREIYENDKEKFSYNNQLKMMEANGDYLSKSTLSRLFGNNWEKYSFDYENTIRPIAKVLIGIENIDETDDLDTKAMKSLLKYKIQRIEELEAQIEQEKSKYHAKLAEETAKFQRSLAFATHQIELKDKRIDQLLNANDRLSITNDRLINQLMDCPLRNECE